MRRLRRVIDQHTHRDDRGAAMAAVIGVMAVGLIITAVIATLVTSSLAFTSGTRAGVQSQAAAEAGVAAARAGLIAGECVGNGGVFESVPGAATPYFATVWTPLGSGWQRGCPVSVVNPVRILSTGYASSPGVAGVSGSDETHLEAILSAIVSAGDIVPSGPAVYAYQADGFGGSGTLVSVDDSSPSVLVKTGDVECSGSSGGDADWVVDNGSLSVSGSCSIAGNVWASERVTLSGSVRISGNVVADGITIGSSTIGRNAWSTADITMSGGGTAIESNATADSLDMNSSTRINGSAWVYGGADLHSTSVIGGRLTAQSLSGRGTPGSLALEPEGPGPSPYLTPPRPFVPNWVDFGYDPIDWPGYTIVPLVGTCSDTQFQNALAIIGSNKGVIDARDCQDGEFALGGNTKLPVQDDLAIIATQFDLDGSAGFTATDEVVLRLVIPDEIDNNLPDCPVDGEFEIGGSVTFSPSISTMIYTPCEARIASGLTIKGQLFAGRIDVGGSATIAYDPVGLPGVDLSTGESSGLVSSEADRTVESLRVVAEGN